MKKSIENNKDLNYEIKIYLKKVKRPLTLIVSKKEYFEEIYYQLSNKKDIIKINNFMFLYEDFRYATLENI